MHPRIYAASDIGRKVNELVRSVPRTTSYKAIDAYERLVRQGIVDLVPTRRPGDGGIYHERDEIELGLSYARHAVSGRWSFRFSREASEGLHQLARRSPPPLGPVAPAYFEFDCDVEYAPGRKLSAAYLSRGEVGSITFISDVGSRATRGNAMTLLLPNSLRLQDVLAFSEARIGTQDVDPQTLLERTLSTLGNDGPAGGLATIAALDDQISECLFPRMDWPEAPLAASLVLAAAAAAGERNAEYAAPQYHDEGPLTRNWLAADEHPRPDTLVLREERWQNGEDLMEDVR